MAKPRGKPTPPKSPMQELREQMELVNWFHNIVRRTKEYQSFSPEAQDIVARYESSRLSQGNPDTEKMLYSLFKKAMEPPEVKAPPAVPKPTQQDLMRAEDEANALAQYQSRNRTVGMVPRTIGLLSNTAGDLASMAGNTLGAVANVPFATMQAAANATGNQTEGERELGFANIGQAMSPIAQALGAAPQAAIGGATNTVSNLFHGLGNQVVSSAAERVAQANNLRLQNDLLAASSSPSQRRLGERFVSANTQMYKNNAK